MLATLIRTRNLTTATAAAIVEELNAQTIKKTDRRLKYVRDLIDAPGVGPMNANLVLLSLQKAGRGEIAGIPSELCLSEWHLLNGAGSDVGRPGVQAMLTGLGQLDNWPDGLADAIKRIGIWNVSPAEDAGLDVVTADQVEAAMQIIRHEDQVQDWRIRFDAAINAIGTDEQNTAAADVLAIAEEMSA